MINRRSLITGLISFVAAPAIVRASNLMPIKTMLNPVDIRVILGEALIAMWDPGENVSFNDDGTVAAWKSSVSDHVLVPVPGTKAILVNTDQGRGIFGRLIQDETIVHSAPNRRRFPA